MALKKGYRQMLDEANARIETLPVSEALKLHGDADTIFVDIRDVRELERDGMVEGAFHAPRGMLEFWADPQSPYHKEQFASGKRLLLYCASGWRSALAADTLTQMGIPNVAHIEGGYNGWKKEGGKTAERPKKK